MSIITKTEVALRAINAVYQMTGSRQRTADILGVDGSTVTRVLKRAGKTVQQPGGQNKQLSPSTLVTAYWERGESLRTIATRAGVAHSTVLRTMNKYGIPTRTV